MFPEQHARLLFRQEPQNFLTNIWQPFSALALTAPPEMCMIWHQRSAGPASEISVESAANAGETEKRVNRVNPASQGNEQIYIYIQYLIIAAFKLCIFELGFPNLLQSSKLTQIVIVTLVISHPSAPATASPFEVSSLDLPRCSAGQTPDVWSSTVPCRHVPIPWLPTAPPRFRREASAGWALEIR